MYDFLVSIDQNFKMSLPKFIAVSLVMLISSSSHHKYQVSSFWLTDMTMFQQPITISTQQQQQDVINSNLAEMSRDSNPTKSVTVEEGSSFPKTADNAIPRVAKVSAKGEKVSFVDNNVSSNEMFRVSF